MTTPNEETLMIDTTIAGHATDDIPTMNDIAPGPETGTEGDKLPATDAGASERTRTADPFITSDKEKGAGESVNVGTAPDAGTTEIASDDGDPVRRPGTVDRRRQNDDRRRRRAHYRPGTRATR